MTREEAIEAIEIHEAYMPRYGMQVIKEALDMAIAALREQEELARRAHDVASDKQVNASNKRLTNADHIRSMTDEELAKLLLDPVDEKVCPNGCDGCDGDCDGKMLNWLHQPYEEVT